MDLVERLASSYSTRGAEKLIQNLSRSSTLFWSFIRRSWYFINYCIHVVWLHLTSLVSAFLLYMGSVIVLVFILIFYFAPQCGHTNVLVFTGICSLMGSLSVNSDACFFLSFFFLMHKHLRLDFVHQIDKFLSRIVLLMGILIVGSGFS